MEFLVLVDDSYSPKPHEAGKEAADFHGKESVQLVTCSRLHHSCQRQLKNAKVPAFLPSTQPAKLLGFCLVLHAEGQPVLVKLRSCYCDFHVQTDEN